MKTLHKFFALKIATVVALGFILASCTKEKDFSNDYDIPWPIPTITGFSAESADIESELTLSGTNLDRVTEVVFSGNQRIGNDAIISKNATSVVVNVPRLSEAGPISVNTNLAKPTTSDLTFKPIYPEAVVEEWPAVLFPGQSAKIKGQNMDMIVAVSVNGQRMAIDGNANTPTELTFSLEMVELEVGVDAFISLEARNGVNDPNSPAIPVEEYVESNFFDAIDPLILLNFEDAVDPYVSANDGSITDASSINGASIPKGRGNSYFTLTADVGSGANWNSIGSIALGTDIDLSAFTDPHLTFMVNTNGKRGYFQVEMEQDGNGRGGHFVQNLTGDDYTFPITDGWEWRTVRLADLNGANGGWGDPIDPTGKINLNFGIKQGNGGNFGTEFELNLDQVMITDGPRNATALAFDFEDGVNPYDGSATAGINGAGVVNFEEDNYLSVELADNVAKWNWTGQIEYSTAIDLSTMEFPYLSLAVNTGGAKGYFQLEVWQNDTKWGVGQTAPDYFFETNGEWQMVNLLLTPELFANWGGNAAAFDPQGILEYVKIGFTTGNVENEKYELSVDQVFISDGKVF